MTQDPAELDDVEDGATGEAIPAGPHPLADIQPGIYGDIPEHLYHSGPGISISTLKRFAKAPAKALVQRKETASLRFGTLTHFAILQPELLASRYHVVNLPRLNARDKAYKAEQERAGGRNIVQQKDWDNAMRISDAVRQHSVAREILAEGLLIEQSAYWTDPETGLLCRSRMDIVRPDMAVIGDLKSTADASPEEFARSVANYGYDWQNAHYVDGIGLAPGGFDANAFLFIAVEPEPPFLVGVYELKPDDIERARDMVRTQMRAYAQCTATNTWPGYPLGVVSLDLPGWYQRRAA